MKNILLTIAYDGSGFHGWQRQLEQRTVQGELENALSNSLGSTISIDGTSRTDTGVHALGQRASFMTHSNVPVDKLPMILNNSLANGKIFTDRIPGEIAVIDAKEVPDDFHARFNAIGKTYIYKIRCAKDFDIFKRNYCCQISSPLDVAKMEESAKYIMGTHDFKSFETTGGTPRDTTVRTVFDLAVKEDVHDNESDITIQITGDGFLYNMVRIISGTLMEVGLGKKTPESIEDIIIARNREKAGQTAPPGGLYLKEVYYNKEDMDAGITT